MNKIILYYMKYKIQFTNVLQVTQSLRIGGKHPYEFIKRNFSQFLSNQLAEKYS